MRDEMRELREGREKGNKENGEEREEGNKRGKGGTEEEKERQRREVIEERRREETYHQDWQEGHETVNVVMIGNEVYHIQYYFLEIKEGQEREGFCLLFHFCTGIDSLHIFVLLYIFHFDICVLLIKDALK